MKPAKWPQFLQTSLQESIVFQMELICQSERTLIFACKFRRMVSTSGSVIRCLRTKFYAAKQSVAICAANYVIRRCISVKVPCLDRALEDFGIAAD